MGAKLGELTRRNVLGLCCAAACISPSSRFGLSASTGALGQVTRGSTLAQVYSHGYVHAAVVQADGKIIIGGEFAFIDGTPRNNIARINVDGTVDATWNPTADEAVKALAIDASGNIFAGGYFNNIGGHPRSKIAKLSASTGTLIQFGMRMLMMLLSP